MSKRTRRTAAGFSLALSLALSATPALQAARSQAHRVAASPNVLTVLWSYLVGGDPHGPHTAQGPTVDPNGAH